MAVPNRPNSQNKYTPQYMGNTSFDETYYVNTVEIVAEDTNVLRRLQADSNGALKVTGAGGGTQYNIDTALGATDTTTLAGVVRDDSLTTLTEADGDVSVLRVSATGALHVTGGGGGTEYTEDTATANPIIGTATMIERDDALSTVTPIEGNWIGLRGSEEGALWTQDFNSDAIRTALEGTLTVDGSAVTQPVSGTFWQATQPVSHTALTELATAINTNELDINIATDSVGIGGGTQYAVDAALGATPTGTLAIGIRDDALTTLTPVEGDAIGLRVNSTGALWVIPSGTVTVDGSGVTQPVSGTFWQATQPISASSLPLPTGAATSANQQTDALTDTELRATAVPVSGTFWQTTQPVSAASLPLPSGAATSANQLADDHNVTVTSIANTPINGPGEPTIDSYTQLAINLTTGADQVLVSSAASKQIWVYGIVYTCSVAGTVSFQDEDDLAITGILDHAANSGLSHPPSGNFAMPIWKLATNKDLEVDITSADVDGFLNYAIVSV